MDECEYVMAEREDGTLWRACVIHELWAELTPLGDCPKAWPPPYNPGEYLNS